MSKITLKPLDDGQKAVEIPVGKTTIGRGPFLGCSDKKVSRNHAVLEVTSKGEVFLTPTHVNPCFYQPTADSPGVVLKKDVPHKLENGDSFSLLPRAFRYQLIITGEASEDKTNQNDLNKQSGKTNGSAGEGDELLNEQNKDAKSGRAISNDELNDANTVTDKPFLKEDDVSVNLEKNCQRDENTFAKKIDVSDDKSSWSKDKESVEVKDNTDKSKTESNSEVKTESSKEDRLKAPESKNLDEGDDESQDDQICVKSDTNDKVDTEKSKFSEKVVEENESTLGNDCFSKDKVEYDQSESNDKSDSKSVQDKLDDKNEESGLNDDEKENEEVIKDEVDKDDEKTRNLPDWMESDDMPPPKEAKKRGRKPQNAQEKKPPKRKTTPDTPLKTKGRRKAENFDFEGESSSQRNAPGRTSSRTNRQTRQGLSLEDFIVSDDDEWQSDRSSPKPKRKRGARKRGDDSGSDWEVEHKKTKKATQKFGSGSESGSDWGSQKRKKQGPRGRRKKSKRPASDEGSDDEIDPPSSEASKKSRIPCTYGKKCYRRNQNHLDQFSHPGDSDYDGSEVDDDDDKKSETVSAAISDSEEDDTNKKECPYGANCYRKNPQHKKDFKHTKKVRPQREAAKQADKKTKSSRNSDEVDSYDLNDSLLNDDSDEYKPVDSGSDYESGEKTKRFTKGKGAKNKRGKKV